MKIASRTVEAEIEIEAPLELVWDVLVDFPRYPEWNPFTIGVETDLTPGNAVGLTVALFGKPRKFTERFAVYEPPKRIGWGMHLLGGRILRGVRYQELEVRAPGRTLYRTHERFDGPLAWLVILLTGAEVRRGFQSNAKALKERAESLARERT